MIDLNQTPGNDNQLIVYIKIEFDDVVYKIASRENAIVGYNDRLIDELDLVINNQNDDVRKGVVLSDEIIIEIPRYIKDDYLSDFQNSLYPNANKSHFYQRRVSIGIGWEGPTNENTITWIYTGYIKSLDYDTKKMTFVIKDDIEDLDIPTEKFNKNDYPEIPENNDGEVKPIVFGNLTYSFLYYDDGTTNNVILNYNRLAPAVLINKRNGTFFVSQLNSYIVPFDKQLNYGTTYINKQHIVMWDDNNNCAIAYVNNAFTNGAIVNNNTNGYWIKLLDDSNGAANNFRVFFKYKFLNIGKYKANNSERLLDKKAGYEVHFIQPLTLFSYEISEFKKDFYGPLNITNVALAIHSGPGVNILEVQYYDKTNQTLVDYSLNSLIYPKTIFINIGNLYQKLNGNYEIVLRLLASVGISNIYTIGYDLPIDNNNIVFN